MYLKSIKKGIWSVYEVCDEDNTSPLMAWYHTLNQKYHGSIKRLFAIIKQVSEGPHGPRLLPKDISHEANKNHSIYEFIAGDLRLLWFYSKHTKKVIICSCQHLKKGNKVNKQETARIIKLKQEFSEACSDDNVIYFDDED